MPGAGFRKEMFAMKVAVRDLPYDTTIRDLRQLFEAHGDAVSILWVDEGRRSKPHPRALPRRPERSPGTRARRCR